MTGARAQRLQARLAVRLAAWRAGWHSLRMPRARLEFHLERGPGQLRAVYRSFTSQQPGPQRPRYRTLGTALIDLGKFARPDDYRTAVSARDHAGDHARRARERGYVWQRIDRNDHLDDLHDIHAAAETRQGRPMDPAYRVRPEYDDNGAPFECYGVFDPKGRLAAYCNIGVYGNFAATDRLLGYQNKHALLHFLLFEIVCMLIARRQQRYFMFGSWPDAVPADPGQHDFKHRLGFQPYRVDYSIR